MLRSLHLRTIRTYGRNLRTFSMLVRGTCFGVFSWRGLPMLVNMVTEVSRTDRRKGKGLGKKELGSGRIIALTPKLIAEFLLEFLLGTPISVGYVKEFLSAKFWIPLSRLNYSAYLIHLTLINVMFVGHRTGLHYTKHLMVLTNRVFFIQPFVKRNGCFWPHLQSKLY